MKKIDTTKLFSCFGNISLILLLLMSISFKAYSNEIPKIISVKCESRNNPLGITSRHSILSWKFASASRNISQSSYQILVSDDSAALLKNKGTCWDSGKIKSAESIQISYAGLALESGKTYYWKVKIWDSNNQSSSWSKPAKWQMGLFNEKDWSGAKWIGYEELPESERIVPGIHMRSKHDDKNNILPLLRKKFSVKKDFKKATIFISGLGHFELSLNGKKVENHFLEPGWTNYDDHALYVTYDLTKSIKEGDNALGAVLGNGFYFIPRDVRYRKITAAFGYPKLICRLVLEYKDGTIENVISDQSWKTAPSPITYTSIYGGEDYNATLEQKGWDTPLFDDSTWGNVITVKGSPVLISQEAEPLKIFDEFKPIKISEPKPGIHVYDMGQNASAIPSIEMSGAKGAIVKVSPGELLNEDGTINQSASGGPHYYQYTLKGSLKESWQPKFTYYGFRYIQIEGAVPQKQSKGNLPIISSVRSLHIRNAAKSTGSFSSSNELFNKTYNLIKWAIKSNMVSVFTDCPHREKLGWLEEAHLVGSSMQYNYDINTLCRKVTQDMMAAQTLEGLIPIIAPEYAVFDNGFRDSPEWGSNGIILPWYNYQWYGDTRILEENYPMMQKYIDYLASKAKNNILSHGLGDWYDIGPKEPGEAQLTPKSLTATAIYYYDLNILSRIAHLLQKPEDEKKYIKLAFEVKNSFNKLFFNKDTQQYSTGSQTANGMAIYMNLVEPEFKLAVTENLVKEIKSRNNSLTAGDIGYRYLLRVLDDAGRSDVIYDMNNRSDVPGYGWQLAHGATALTESWQAYGFVSNNHFMLGHLMEWFYTGLAGICQNENSIAYKQLEIRPQLVGDITSASATYESPYGTVKSSWKRHSSSFDIYIDIPANSSANVYVPALNQNDVTESGKVITENQDIKFVKMENGKAVYTVGSGKYHFISKI